MCYQGVEPTVETQVFGSLKDAPKERHYLMRTENMKFLGAVVTMSALFLAGCGDSGNYGQGGAPTSEVESSSETSAMTNSEPGVAPEPGVYGESASQRQDRQFNSLGSASAPSANVPANVATNGTDRTETSEGGSEKAPANIQGSQASPEQNTGDDVNPDQIDPERK